jgi:hypothetical protein
MSTIIWLQVSHSDIAEPSSASSVFLPLGRNHRVIYDRASGDIIDVLDPLTREAVRTGSATLDQLGDPDRIVNLIEPIPEPLAVIEITTPADDDSHLTLQR